MTAGPSYVYNAVLDRTVDGDTVYLRVDLGFRVFASVEFRLARVNAPEMKGESRKAGEASRDFLDALLAGKALRVQSDKSRDKYGRWIGEVYYLWKGDWHSASDELLVEGHAVPFVAR